jgi:hypothetical protein
MMHFQASHFCPVGANSRIDFWIPNMWRGGCLLTAAIVGGSLVWGSAHALAKPPWSGQPPPRSLPAAHIFRHHHQRVPKTILATKDHDTVVNNNSILRNTRRSVLLQSLWWLPTATCSLALSTGGVALPAEAAAIDVTTSSESTANDVVVVPMKLFVDPQGLFVLSLPQRFFVLRRTAKGDLPDESTGKGRRGSSILNAGDLAKAEVLAVERCVPCARVLRSCVECVCACESRERESTAHCVGRWSLSSRRLQ